MRSHLLSPGAPDQRTGGYLYNARLGEALAARGHALQVHALPGEWPLIAEGWACARNLDGIPAGEPVLADGLLWLGLGALRQRVLAAHPVVVLVHSLLDLEGPTPGAGAGAELAAFSEARGLVATSAWTARLLRARGFSAAIAVAEPGTEPAQRSPCRGDPPVLLCVGTLTRRKGQDLLLEALWRLRGVPWRAHLVGSRTRNRPWADQMRARVTALGLGGRVGLCGELDGPAMEAAYRGADVLVSAARSEPYGMALAEGLARGLAVVSTPAGALEGRSDALVVEAESADALARALGPILRDPAVRRALQQQAGRAPLHTWAGAACTVDAVLRAACG